MDEKGFQLSQALKVKDIYRQGRKNPCYSKDGQCTMVTVIDCIAADGRVIPPMYIYNGGKHLQEWHAGVKHNEEASFAWSTKGWTDIQLRLEWVGQNIEKYTIKMFVPLDWPSAHANYSSAKGKPRILILDGYGSDLIWQFFDFYLKSNIHPTCLPANSTHMLKPRDVGLFGPLSQCNSNELDLWVTKGGNAIKKG